MAEASKQPFLSGSYFYVNLMARDADNNAIELTGRFTSVSGLGMEVEYEVYTEGGSEFPRYFYKETKPQTLVLEQGVVTQADNVAKLMEGCIQGQMIPLTGTIELRDSFNQPAVLGHYPGVPAALHRPRTEQQPGCPRGQPH